MLTFEHQADSSRYAMFLDGALAGVLDYRDDGRTIALTRAFTVPTFRGRGLAAELVNHVVTEWEARGDRVISPVCWYVADWFAENPHRAAILRAAS